LEGYHACDTTGVEWVLFKLVLGENGGGWRVRWKIGLTDGMIVHGIHGIFFVVYVMGVKDRMVS
jgi:hypothetical protein